MKRVAIFGATGVAGSAVIEQSLSEPRMTEVVAVTRRLTGIDSPKLNEVICNDFLNLELISDRLNNLDACFYCLGIAQSQAKDPSEYREITYDYALSAARALRSQSPGCIFHFLSGMGTDPSGKSSMMWARIKGETELALADLGLAGLVCWRPGYIYSVRPVKGRPFGDRIMRMTYPVFRGFSGMSVTSTNLGKAMLQATFNGLGHGILENRDIRELAKQYDNP
ncbi:MAG: epimerase [Proteobacteria bacterium]|nr:epimerase [Pseudomonadota bacterium]